MSEKKLPELSFIINEENEKFAEIIASPLPKGMGDTIGNSMRRTLLNSLSGAAITWVRIDGVQHEYSSIDGMTEAQTSLDRLYTALRGCEIQDGEVDNEFSFQFKKMMDDDFNELERKLIINFSILNFTTS